MFIGVDKDGKETEYAYRVFSAYEGTAIVSEDGAYLFPIKTDATTRISGDFMFNKPTGTNDDYADYMLGSVNAANAQAPATNAKLINYRLMAENRSWATHGINVLFMVYYASTNWQGILSNGVANLASGSFNSAVSTGHTSTMLNRSGYRTNVTAQCLEI